MKTSILFTSECLLMYLSAVVNPVQVSRDKLQLKLDQLRSGKTFQELDEEDSTAVGSYSLVIDF